jgi:uncharacterized protein (DUF488 family)
MNHILNDVLTVAEAAELWGLNPATIRAAISNEKLTKDNIKKSAGTWLIMKSEMEKVYGNLENELNLFTIGYEGKSIDDFLEILVNNEIHMIFDVREIPFSRKKGFSKAPLSEALKSENIDYYSFKELGSPKDIREELHRTNNYENFFKEYIEYLNNNPQNLESIINAINMNGDKNICLLCFEKDYNYCHRYKLAREILNRDDKISKIINL